MKTRNHSSASKYIIFSLCYALISLYTAIAHAKNSNVIMGIETITSENDTHKTIIERNIGTNNETRTFSFTFTLDRDLGEPSSTSFILTDNQSNTYEGIINKPREICNAYNKPDKTQDYYPCHVEATFPTKTYTSFQITIMDISGNKIDSFSGTMPELEINLDSANNTLLLKNISDQELEIKSITSGDYIKLDNNHIKIASKETCAIKLNLETKEEYTQTKDKIFIQYKTNDKPITTIIDFNLDQHCVCPTYENNQKLTLEKTNTEMAVSILPIENGKYKVMLFLKNDDISQKLLNNYSIKLLDDTGKTHNLEIDQNTIADQDCLEFIGTRGCFITFEGTVKDHKNSDKYISFQASITYQNQFGTKNTQSFSSNMLPEISCEIVKNGNGNYALVIKNLSGDQITIVDIHSPELGLSGTSRELSIYKGKSQTILLNNNDIDYITTPVIIHFNYYKNNMPKTLALPFPIIDKGSSHWYDSLLLQTTTPIAIAAITFGIYAFKNTVHQIRNGLLQGQGPGDRFIVINVFL